MNNDANQTILIVDGNSHDAKKIQDMFRGAGDFCQAVSACKTAIRWIEHYGLPDLAIVDTDLKHTLGGFDFCAKIHKVSDLPIIMTSPNQDPAVAVKALTLYAEDFVAKPYPPQLLFIRARRLLTRFESTCPDAMPIEVDYVNRRMQFDDQVIRITPIEAKLLHILQRHTGQALSLDYIMRRLWPQSAPDPSKLRVNIFRLRSKLELIANEPNYIQSRKGSGYGWFF